jgi:hypothetical protein
MISININFGHSDVAVVASANIPVSAVSQYFSSSSMLVDSVSYAGTIAVVSSDEISETPLGFI